METFSIVFRDGLHLFLYLLFAHLIGDFLLQPAKLLLWKKRENKGILAHVSIHFVVTCILLSPYIFMSSGGLYTLLGILGIVVVHFFIDQEKIKLEKKTPANSFKLYVIDQCAHVSVILIFTLLLQFIANVEFGGSMVVEMYLSKQFVFYLISLICVTYTWEITKYEKHRNVEKKLKAFSPNIKNMMIRGFIVSAIFMIFTPFTVNAASSQYATSDARNANITGVVPKQFSFGDTVTINGNGFGDEMTQYSQVCWGKLCINKDSITTWTDTEIKFTMNVLGMPSQGESHIVRLNGSGLYTEDAKGDTVTVLPTIGKLYDDRGNQIFSLTAGQTVTVTGYYFGNTMGILKLDDVYVSQVQPWTTGEITFIVPELKNPTTKMTIKRSNGSQVVFDINSHTGLSNDEFSHLQTYLFNANVDKAWSAFETRGAGVVVALLDDGVDMSHPDLKHAIWQNIDEIKGDGIDNDNNGYIDDVNGYNFRDNGTDLSPKGDHGTLVAGVIAAKANNQIGIAGIAPGAKIMPLTVCGLENCSGNAVYNAVRYAVDNGADIINMSLTGFGNNPIFDPSYDQVMEYAHDRGVFVIVAAGNGNQELSKAQKYYGRNFDKTPISPVCNDGSGDWVVGVASINSQLSNSVFSDYGSKCIDISAYGEAVYSTSVAEFSSDGKTYGYAYGTSFATPQIAGALALAKSAFPKKGMEDLKTALLESGILLDTNLALEYKGGFGRGLDIYGFLNQLSGFPDVQGEPQPSPTQTVNDTVMSQGAFSDIGGTHKSYMAITYLSGEGVIEGYEDGTFKPENDVNRAELLKLLLGGQGIDPDQNRYRNCFTDVNEEWFARYVCYAKSQGWVDGYSDGSFRPAQTVNKVEALKMMVKSYGLTLGQEQPTYVDVHESDWFYQYVALGQKLGILEERGALFNASRGKSRASIAENIFRILAVQAERANTYTAEIGAQFIAQLQI
ncbi:MAG: DUF3307 domain-containing protein [Candidatus Peregrinibacteria bacterium]|nr:DUF3307 domain-containing protein [Candidatus Peregrinibacteria bacterium]MDZ4244728.1 DUF3307 domain-containing protein [Candidatus Gracilibacteria bacterium]